MNFRLISADTTLVVSVADMKDFARVETTDEDALMEALIQSATEIAQQRTGTALYSQLREIVLDSFPAGEITLPYPEIKSVESVTYLDTDDAEQTLATDQYDVFTSGYTGYIDFSGDDLPELSDKKGAVTVRYRCGGSVSERMKQAIKMLAAHWYNNRESTTERKIMEVPQASDMIFDLEKRTWL